MFKLGEICSVYSCQLFSLCYFCFTVISGETSHHKMPPHQLSQTHTGLERRGRNTDQFRQISIIGIVEISSQLDLACHIILVMNRRKIRPYKPSPQTILRVTTSWGRLGWVEVINLRWGQCGVYLFTIFSVLQQVIKLILVTRIFSSEQNFHYL